MYENRKGYNEKLIPDKLDLIMKDKNLGCSL